MSNRTDRYAVRSGFEPLPEDASPAQKFARLLSEDMPPIIKMAHDSGDPQVIYHCFGGETRFLTRDGVMTLAEAAGTTQWVLTGSIDEPHGGYWMQAPVQELGEQELWEVTLKRNQKTKVIRATAGHRWLVRRPDRVVTTDLLSRGHRLAKLRPQQFDITPDREGIRMGFVFGDGAIQHRQSTTYGVATLWGSKRDLSKYFDEIATRAYEVQTDKGVPGLRYTSGMKGYTKTLPSLTDTPEYLLGWLMGYFAADGSMDAKGCPSISSSSIDDLLHVRDIALVLGIGTFEPSSKLRTGFGVTSMIHNMSLAPDDLLPEFFLRDDQRARVKATPVPPRLGWTVESVRPTGKIEPVYCIRAHGTNAFTLEDNILTGNCPSCGSGQVIARSDGSVSCGFCKMCFTVQIQPDYPAFPQTINGVPVQVPGMGPQWPGQDTDDMMRAQNAADGIDVPPGDEEDPEATDDPQAADGPPDDVDADDGGNPFAKKSYRTASGTVLTEDQLLRRIALESTPNRAAMLRVIRKKNGVA
jgi:hypothetical protein